MDLQANKCVMVVYGGLPLGMIANTAAILGISLGRSRPELVGSALPDQSGAAHAGIIRIPIPVLQAEPAGIKQLWEALSLPEFREITAVDFSVTAQSCRTYEEFARKMSQTAPASLQYLGVALCGPKKQVNRLTGNLPLLR